MFSMEIAYLLARGAFSWLFTVDDFIMVVPYFWSYLLSYNNDVQLIIFFYVQRVPKTFAYEGLILALCSFLFFCMGMFELVNAFSRWLMTIVGICYILVRFVWLFHAYSIFKSYE